MRAAQAKSLRFESQVSIRAYTEGIKNDKSAYEKLIG
jgi:hypothetical protein